MSARKKTPHEPGKQPREEPEEKKIKIENADSETTSSDDADSEAVGAEVEPAEGVVLSPEEAAALIQEKEEQYDRLLRLQADFENYRKRVQKEQVNLIKYGAENALVEILPVVDNLERAVESARAHGNSNSQLREGVELILSQFMEALKKLGVTPIESVGHPFDPNKHDALLRVQAPEVDEGTVVEEVRRGYYLHDKVLRPAQVTVGTHEEVE
jgi:molecular chaperone GrpE